MSERRAVSWLRTVGPDEHRIDRIDPCEAGTCGHAGCWQDETPAVVTGLGAYDNSDIQPGYPVKGAS